MQDPGTSLGIALGLGVFGWVFIALLPNGSRPAVKATLRCALHWIEGRYSAGREPVYEESRWAGAADGLGDSPLWRLSFELPAGLPNPKPESKASSYYWELAAEWPLAKVVAHFPIRVRYHGGAGRQ